MDEIVETRRILGSTVEARENPELFKEAAEAMKEHQADRFRARRATTINFLNRMSEKGFLTYREATTKGARKGSTDQATTPRTRSPSEDPLQRG